MDPGRIRHVVFDFDGTVGDSYGPVTESFNSAFRHFGKPELTAEEVRPWVGTGLEVILTHFLGRENLEKAVEIFRGHYLRVYKQDSKLMRGARETLDALDGHFGMGLCSNKPGDVLRSLCDHLDISRYFEVILGAYDVEHLKPHPQMLRKAMADLGAADADTLYVGDTVTDAEFARPCGVPYVLVLGGTGTREQLSAAGPARLLESIAELPALLGISESSSP